MKHIKVLGLCLVAVFALSATIAATASAHRRWELINSKGVQEAFTTGEAIPITAKLQTGTKATLESEVIGKPVVIECEALSLENAAILNEETSIKRPTGRDRGVVKFEKCKLTGEASLVCKLTAASAKEIRTPPVGEGRSVLVENTAETEIWDDFLPGTEAKGVAAIIHLEGSLCPIKEDKVVTKLPIKQPEEKGEGEGGVAAKIVPGGEAKREEREVQEFVFPAEAGCPIKAKNWMKETISTNELYDETKEGRIETAKCAKFAARVDVELTGKTTTKWGVE
ncbi:MAG TPA: hypothetical protein VNY52_06390 [Solirubrobacteraceae bacterium]|jgi:hypothetical protein|nr:hypothetical protein [Solirubrobacteraceae bacterium]